MKKTYKILFGILAGLVIVVLGIGFSNSELFQGSMTTTGNIKAILKNEMGITINGKVTAKKGTVVRQCDSAAGRCTLIGLSTGNWTVTAKSGGGSTSASKTVTVKAGVNTNVNLTLVAPANLILITPTTSDSEPVTQVLGVTTFKNLGGGTSLKATGTCKDDHGVLINGVITVYQGGIIKGQSETAAGKYSVYDIPQGDYKFIFKTHGGQSKTKNVTIPSTGKIIVNFQF